MPGRRNTSATIEARQLTVARLMATMEKPTCRRIAAALKKTDPPFKCSKATAANDIKAIRKEWKAERLRSMDEVVGEELEKARILEAQLWRDIGKSKADRHEVNTTTERVPVAVKQPNGETVVEFHEKRTTRTRVIPGGSDPRLAKTMIDLWKRRADLLGLDHSKVLNLDVDTVAFKVDPGHPTWEAPTRSKEDEGRIAALLEDVPDAEED